MLSSIKGHLELKSTGKLNVSLDQNNQFVAVSDASVNEIVVRKSSICKFLNKGQVKLSSDRLQRIRDQEITKRAIQQNSCDETIFLKTCNEINAGDWCFFKGLNHTT